MSTRFIHAMHALAAIALTISVASTSTADTIIAEFLAGAPVPGDGLWYYGDMQAGGQASIVNLTGAGGNLEANQPLPIGAALLTTDGNNSSRADVGTFADFGDAAAFLSNVQLSYSFYKEAVVGGNQFAAPSLKLEIFAPAGTGDNYGHLIYEPGWNQPTAGSQPVPTGDWQSVSIDSNTGSFASTTDGDGSGGWWWSGGFEVPSGAGGPPIRSLNEWITTFQSSDPTDFANARVVGIRMGVGTFNQNQIGYFDDVSYAVNGGASATWNFEPVPEPTSVALLGLATAALISVRRRKS